MCTKFFGAVVLAASLFGGARADDQADAKAILDAGIKAQGGESALSKFTGFYFKVKGTGYGGDQKTPISFEWFVQGTDKMRTVEFDENGKIDRIEVVTGHEGWLKEGDQAVETLGDDKLKEDLDLIYVNWVTSLFPLKGEGFRRSALDEIELAGHKVVGILVEHAKHEPVKLYFDKKTHLLAEYQRKFKSADSGDNVDETCEFSDYRDVQGTKQAFKVVQSWNGTKTSDLQITEMKLYDKPLDEKLFSKP